MYRFKLDITATYYISKMSATRKRNTKNASSMTGEQTIVPALATELITPQRPKPHPTSTNSSASSTSSTESVSKTFDKATPLSGRPESPSTPPDLDDGSNFFTPEKQNGILPKPTRHVSSNHQIADPKSFTKSLDGPYDTPVKNKRRSSRIRDTRDSSAPPRLDATTHDFENGKSLAQNSISNQDSLVDQVVDDENEILQREIEDQVTDEPNLDIPGCYIDSQNDQDIAILDISPSTSPDIVVVQDQTVPQTDQDTHEVSKSLAQLVFIDFDTKLKKTTTRQTNNKIKSYILSLKVCKGDTGWVYAYESPSHASGHVKIGMTKFPPEERIDQWSKCGIPILEILDPDLNDLRHYGPVERLVQLELHRKRKKQFCQHHKKRHDEWFEVSKVEALEIVQRWRSWIRREMPFDEDGTLVPYWRWRAKKLNCKIADVNWDEWTKSGKFSYLHFWLENSKVFKDLSEHLARKDSVFWRTGAIQFLLLYIYTGSKAAAGLYLISLLFL